MSFGLTFYSSLCNGFPQLCVSQLVPTSGQQSSLRLPRLVINYTSSEHNYNFKLRHKMDQLMNLPDFLAITKFMASYETRRVTRVKSANKPLEYSQHSHTAVLHSYFNFILSPMNVYLVVSSLHIFRLQFSATFSSLMRATCTVSLIVLRIVTKTAIFVDAD
jgi:hypothetical protein